MCVLCTILLTILSAIANVAREENFLTVGVLCGTRQERPNRTKYLCILGLLSCTAFSLFSLPSPTLSPLLPFPFCPPFAHLRRIVLDQCLCFSVINFEASFIWFSIETLTETLLLKRGGGVLHTVLTAPPAYVEYASCWRTCFYFALVCMIIVPSKMSICLSVCLSHAGVLSKRLNISSHQTFFSIE